MKFRPLGDTSGGGEQEVPLQFFVKFLCVSCAVVCCVGGILGLHCSPFGFGTWVLLAMVRQLKQLVKEPDLVQKYAAAFAREPCLKEVRSYPLTSDIASFLL